MLRLSAGGPVCVNGRVVSVSGERASGERMSGATYVTWTGVIKTVRLWVALCQDVASFGRWSCVCEWEGHECIW